MSDLPDLELRRTPSDSSPPNLSSTRNKWLRVAVVVLIAATGAAIYVALAWRPRPAPTPAATPSPTAAATEPSPPLGGLGEPVLLPPLNASDALVRTLVGKLSESPAVTAWLTTNDLIRNFTVAIANIAEGATPAKHLRVLRPTSTFRIIERGGVAYVDPRSYDRYTAIADAVASVDPAGAAKLYATLKPRIEEAHRDLGFSDQPLDVTLERAIVSLLNTPITDARVPLREKGIGYAYADERIEALTAAQKQLLRMGPRNAGIIKARIREIALALGIPAARLPER